MEVNIKLLLLLSYFLVERQIPAPVTLSRLHNPTDLGLREMPPHSQLHLNPKLPKFRLRPRKKNPTLFNKNHLKATRLPHRRSLRSTQTNRALKFKELFRLFLAKPQAFPIARLEIGLIHNPINHG